ncbi:MULTISPECIES: carbohydrate ABC transporter permease [Streptomyces]|uniref:Sugar ABC transporter permease n=1 Tax=Streptomyces evansiae TaxID=3075535 RepID=A0ABU2QUI7_9ACTN|nr:MULTISPECIES: sugar ABC transporter permease [unclassified Streptomyces]MDT0408114.1 sugar ABC transporter permease [Streptomyces sp. DSM 41979]MYQ57471.1 ABC transporter permease subunit [Streptomyces sp. SID4926]SCD69366.1 multiple sugar transport system permease protein [Streptomyces sp. DfronAA-171]
MAYALSKPRTAPGTTSGRTGKVRRSFLLRLAFLVPVVVHTAVFFLYPLVRNLLLSFQDYGIRSVYSGDAPWNGLANYRRLFDDPVFHKTLGNTLVFVVVSLLAQFVIGLGLAEFFRRSFPLGGVLRSLLLVPWLLPLVVAGTVFRWMLDTSNGVVNQVLLALRLVDDPVPWLNDPGYAMAGVLLCNIWIGVPFNMVILHGGLQAIPGALYEAAALDGAGPVARFRYITLPQLRPVIGVVLTLGLVYTLKVFDVIWVMTKGGPANATQTVTTYGYQLSFGGLSQFGLGAAAGNLLIVVATAFALLYLRSMRAEDHTAPGRK